MRAVHLVPIAGLDALTAGLAGLPADDLALVVPVRGARLVGDTADVARAHEPFGDGIAVAAGADRVGGDDALLAVLADELGALPARPHPHPLALCGPVGALSALAAALGDGADDAERLTAAWLTGGHDLVLDLGAQLFCVLDATGTGAVAVDGRLHAGGEHPVVALAADDAALDALDAALADPGGRDLAALLTYRGATDPADGPVEDPAADIVTMPFWTPEFCATVIRAAEAAGIWSADPEDPVPGMEVSLLSISPRLVALLEEDLRLRLWPRLLERWPAAAVTPIHDAFVIRYEPGGAAEHLPLHHDVAQISASIRLNDGFEGGALAFPRQGWDTGGLPVGHLVAWPSLVTHPHAGLPVTRGVKYGLTIWLALPE